MSDTEISRLIQSSEGGNAAARQELFGVLYHELHRIAQRELRRGPGAVEEHGKFQAR